MRKITTKMKSKVNPNIMASNFTKTTFFILVFLSLAFSSNAQNITGTATVDQGQYGVSYNVEGLEALTGNGYLYNWYAASDPNFAPTDWGLPSVSDIVDIRTEYGQLTAGEYLKEASNVYWQPKVFVTNSTGFSAYGSGERYDNGQFHDIRARARFWEEDEYSPTQANYWSLYFGNNAIGVGGYFNKEHGASVRLIYKGTGTPPSTISDYDGNVYDVIELPVGASSQYWIKQNWRSTHLNNGTSLTIVTEDYTAWSNATEGDLYYCAYNNIESNVYYESDIVTYDWTYSGTGGIINGTGSSITINFASDATSGTLSVVGKAANGTEVFTAEFPITINIDEGLVPDDIEYNALVDLYNSTDGPNWTSNTNWLNGTTIQDIAEWYGITLDAEGKDIAQINLGSNNLTGNLPISIGDLEALTHLYLNRNLLSGSIPSELGQLINLTILDLYINSFNGSIPSDLGNISNLQILYLSRNELSGSIPSELGQLINLQYLSLGYNFLSGSIPLELGNLSSLQNLLLYNNELSGSIPDEVGQLSNLINMQVNNNSFIGLPDFVNKGNLSLSAQENNLSFGDIEQFFTSSEVHELSSFSYSNQANVGEEQTLELVTGDRLEISVPASGVHTIYQWQKKDEDGNWQSISGANSASYVVELTTIDDAGNYKCILTNDWVTDLTIESNVKTVVVSQSNTWTVTNTSDDPSVSGSLPWAIEGANAASQGVMQTISFNIPGTGPHEIKLKANSSKGIDIELNNTIHLDGTTQPGYTGGTPYIIIKGIASDGTEGVRNGNATGIKVNSGSCIIEGIELYNYQDEGIDLHSENNIIRNNIIHTIGYDGSEATAALIFTTPNNQIVNNIIGSKYDLSNGYDIYGNGVHIYYPSAINNLIEGNTIINCNNPLNSSDYQNGIFLEAPSKVTITKNVFYGNGSKGIHFIDGGGNNDDIVPPANITAIDNSGTVTISGTSRTGAKIELFESDGPQQALRFISTSSDIIADGSGNWTVDIPSTEGTMFVATQTDPNGNTSELTSPFTITSSCPGSEPGYYYVTNSNDAGAGSLRAAITSSNNNTENLPHKIVFCESVAPYNITLVNQLPNIQQTVEIDASNLTNPVFIDGQNCISVGAMGLIINASNTVIKNFNIQNFTNFGMRIQLADNVEVTSCILSNNDSGIYVHTANSVKIQNCKIGTDVTGTLNLGNTRHGISAFHCNNILIGGSDENSRNIILGGTSSGIYLHNTSGEVSNNNIGVTVDEISIPDSEGIFLSYCNNLLVGGVDKGNVISATLRGITNGGSSDCSIIGNYIGVNRNLEDLGSLSQGIIGNFGNNNKIGGTNIGEGNIIANCDEGIRFYSKVSQLVEYNPIRRNLIYNIQNKGIYFDISTGYLSNNGKKAPIINGGDQAAGIISGTIETAFTDPENGHVGDIVEVFLSDMDGEDAIEFLGEAIVRADNTWELTSGSLPATGDVYVIATITDAPGHNSPNLENTSEFSTPFLVQTPECPGSEPGYYYVTNSNDAGAGSLRAAIEASNATTEYLPHSILFCTDGAPYTINLSTLLPTITQPVEINASGLSEPVHIIGNSSVYNGIRVEASGSKLNNLYFDNFDSQGILIYNADSVEITDCVVSNSYGGIKLQNSTGTTIKGCKLGTDETGMVDVPGRMSQPLTMDGCNNIIIGGDTEAEGNVISENESGWSSENAQNSMGIWNSQNVEIYNNKFGVSVDGAVQFSNLTGIFIDGSTDIIFGKPGAGNLMYVEQSAIISWGSANNLTVQSNEFINPGSLTESAISLNASDNIKVGGSIIGEGNIFRNFYTTISIPDYNGSSYSHGIHIRQNEMHNTNKGISIANPAAPIKWKSPPIIESANFTSNTVSGTIETTLSSSENGTIGDIIELFESDDNGEDALKFIGDAVVDAGGNWSIDISGHTFTDPANPYVIATITQASGSNSPYIENTSEFTAAFAVQDCSTLPITIAPARGPLYNDGCGGYVNAPVRLTVSETYTGYQWFKDNNTNGTYEVGTDDDLGIAQKLEVAEPGEYFVQVTDGFGCSKTTSYNVVAQNNPVEIGRYIVNSNLDVVDPNDGHYTLREAILESNSNIDGLVHFISFCESNAPYDIILSSELPEITYRVSIDGIIMVAGSPVPSVKINNFGLKFKADHCDVNYIEINNSQGAAGIEIKGSSHILVRHCKITSGFNKGILIENSTDITIYNSEIMDCQNGIVVRNSNNVYLGRQGRGVIGNAIFSNTVAGILIEQNSFDVNIDGNKIGLDATGLISLPNGEGVVIKNSESVKIGRGGVVNINYISGNSTNGISIMDNSKEIFIENNKIGADINGGYIPNGNHGIYISNNVSDVKIGNSYFTLDGRKDPSNVIVSSGNANSHGVAIASLDDVLTRTKNIQIVQNHFLNNADKAIKYLLNPTTFKFKQAPVILSIDIPGGSISGEVNTETCAPGDFVELYESDATGKNALEFLGVANVQADGTWQVNGLTLPAGANTNFIATVSDFDDPVTTTIENTSEFSAPFLVQDCSTLPITITPTGGPLYNDGCGGYTNGPVTLTISETYTGYQWFKDNNANGTYEAGTDDDLGTTQVLDVTEPGEYFVQVTDDNNCNDISGYIVVSEDNPSLAGYFYVTNSNDAGEGSLRAAIEASNASAENLPHHIVFCESGEPYNITVTSELPGITKSVIIDARNLTNQVHIDASFASWGLMFNAGSDGSELHNFHIEFATAYGVFCSNVSDITLNENTFGYNPTLIYLNGATNCQVTNNELLGRNNDTYASKAIHVQNSYNTSGSETEIIGNNISCKMSIGIHIDRSEYVNVYGNSVIAQDASEEIGSYSESALLILDCEFINIGSSNAIHKNILQRKLTAISIVKTNNCNIQGNQIDYTRDGISSIYTQNILIGGPTLSHGNIINCTNGITLHGDASNSSLYNTISHNLFTQLSAPLAQSLIKFKRGVYVNNNKQQPIITKGNYTTTATVQGTIDVTTAQNGDIIELYLSDVTGLVATQLLGIAVVGDEGAGDNNWIIDNIDLSGISGDIYVVATITDASGTNAPNLENTSEFSAPFLLQDCSILPITIAPARGPLYNDGCGGYVNGPVRLTFSETYTGYQWFKDNNTNGTYEVGTDDDLGIAQNLHVAEPGEYFVQVTDGFGCSKTTSYNVVAQNNPVEIGRYIVNSNLDVVDPNDGHYTLREAILESNSNIDSLIHYISFCEGNVPYDIILSSELPEITYQTRIDGSIKIAGNPVPSVKISNFGLKLKADYCFVNYIEINNSQGAAGIEIEGCNHTTVNQCKITSGLNKGVLIENSTDIIINNSEIMDFQDGIVVRNSNNVYLGRPSRGFIGNAIFSNSTAGVLIEQNSFDVNIYGNKIGLDATGLISLPNGEGVVIKNSESVKIGGGDVVTINYISGNSTNGISIMDNSKEIFIENNKIGADINGGYIPNGNHGIYISNNVSDVKIGNSYFTLDGRKDPSNVIVSSGNANSHGVAIASLDDVLTRTKNIQIVQNHFLNNADKAIKYLLNPTTFKFKQAPVILSIDIPGGSISGEVNTETCAPGDFVELYESDATGKNALEFLGVANVQADGTWQVNGLTLSAGANTNFIATVSDFDDPVTTTIENTSEFSQVKNVCDDFIPVAQATSNVLYYAECQSGYGNVPVTLSLTETYTTYQWYLDANGNQLPDAGEEIVSGTESTLDIFDIGTYIVQVTDVNGCSGATNITITAATDPASVGQYFVWNSNDSGEGSLRAAIEASNENTEDLPHSIIFCESGNPYNITLSSALPEIKVSTIVYARNLTNKVNLDANGFDGIVFTTDADNSSISNFNISNGFYGIRGINADNLVITDNEFYNNTQAISLTGSDCVINRNKIIGEVDPGVTSSSKIGIYIGGTNHLIGSDDGTVGNIINKVAYGIRMQSGHYIDIYNNLIGIDENEQVNELANNQAIRLFYSDNIKIGGDKDLLGNKLYAKKDAVYTYSCHHIYIQGNEFGVEHAIGGFILNTWYDTQNVLVGGRDASLGNTYINSSGIGFSNPPFLTEETNNKYVSSFRNTSDYGKNVRIWCSALCPNDNKQPPIIETVNIALKTVSGTIDPATGNESDIVEVYRTDASGNAGMHYLGEAIVSGGKWTLENVEFVEGEDNYLIAYITDGELINDPDFGNTSNSSEVFTVTYCSEYQISIPDEVCEGEELSFNFFRTNGFATANSIHWDFGDGMAIIEDNPVHSYLSSGTYTVTLTADMQDCPAFVTTKSIIVNPLPEINFTGLETPVCIEEPGMNLSGNQAQGIYSGSGITDNGDGTATFQASTAGYGIHNVAYSYTIPATGCANQDVQQVTVQGPMVSIIGLEDSYCKDVLEFDLIGNPLGGSFTVNGNPATIFDPSSLPTGTYTIEYTYTDIDGCTGIVSQDVDVHELPIVDIVVSQPLPVCSGTALTFTANVTYPSGGEAGPYTYDWQPVSGIGQNMFIAPTENQTVSVTVTDANGCSGTQTFDITVWPLPQINVADIEPVSCRGAEDGAAEFNITSGTSNYSYWITPFNRAISPRYEATGVGEGSPQRFENLMQAQHTLSVTDANGCKAREGLNIGFGGPVISVCAKSVPCNVQNGETTSTQFTILATRKRPPATGVPYSYNITDGTNVVYTGIGNYEVQQLTPDVSIEFGKKYYLELQTDGNNSCEIEPVAISIQKNYISLSLDERDGVYDQCAVSDPVDVEVTSRIGVSSCTLIANGDYQLQLVKKIEGSDPVQYETVVDWTTPSSDTHVFSGLFAGEYLINTGMNGVTGCVSKKFTVSAATVMEVTIFSEDVSCMGGSDGYARASVKNSVAPLSYEWYTMASGSKEVVSTSSNTGDILAADVEYFLVVTDSRGCGYQESSPVSFTLSQPEELTLSPIDLTEPCNPSVEVLGGGTPPYMFQWIRFEPTVEWGMGFSGLWEYLTGEPKENIIWEDYASTSSSRFEAEDLRPSDYFVRVYDANGCIAETDLVTIETPEPREYQFAFYWETKAVETEAGGGRTPPTHNQREIESTNSGQALENAMAKCIANNVAVFAEDIIGNCFEVDSIEDEITIDYLANYYQYTLYYYDRAGNLIKTVSPQGVNPLEGSSVNRNTSPGHTLETKYDYNNLGQLVYQETPDGGITKFIYNDIGQLRFSQNAIQEPLNRFSYTKYDQLGRVVEIGEAEISDYSYTTQGGSNTVTLSHFNDLAGSGLTSTDKISYEQLSVAKRFPTTSHDLSEQVVTTYSIPEVGVDYFGKPQRYLNNRVSYVRSNDKNGSVNSTYYSYDPHGNVEWMIQEIDGIEKQHMAYEYDLISGNVRKVKFNEEREDRFFHRYTYDEDNRIVSVETSRDGFIWDQDAEYDYYKHGPLKSIALGQDNIQHVDYTYTLQGWLKAINTPDLTGLNNEDDGFAQDAFGMVLGYYEGDFTRTGTPFESSASNPFYLAAKPGKDLYNGNISTWTTNTATPEGATGLEYCNVLTGYQYTYDKLNRIKSGQFNVYNAGSFGTTDEYGVDYTYDFNGNLLSLNRAGNNTNGLGMDNLTYHYYANSNKLERVDDNPANAGNYDSDIDDQDVSNYKYDDIGNLVRDEQERMSIEWNLQGKVAQVIPDENPGDQKPHIKYTYDAAGNRVTKFVNTAPAYNTGVLTDEITDPTSVTITYYVRDAQGNIMAVYERTNRTESDHYMAEFRLKEIPLYGSDRLGEYKHQGEALLTEAFTIDQFNDVKFEFDEAVLQSAAYHNWFAVSKDGTDSYINQYVYDEGTNTYVSGTLSNTITDGIVKNNMVVAEDIAGNLQFYACAFTDATETTHNFKVFDADGNEMAGSAAIDCNAAKQSIVIKVPGETSLYYLLTVNTPGAIYYHTIDMTANGGKGEVIEANMPLAVNNFNYTGHFAVVENYNNNQYHIFAAWLQNNIFEDDYIARINKFTLAGKLTEPILAENMYTVDAVNVIDLKLDAEAQNMLLYYMTDVTTKDPETESIESKVEVFGLDNKYAINTGATSIEFTAGETYKEASAEFNRYATEVYYMLNNDTEQKLMAYNLLTGAQTELQSNVTGELSRGTNGLVYLAEEGNNTIHIVDPGAIESGITLPHAGVATLPLQAYRTWKADQTGEQLSARVVGQKQYELKDHLGNVRALVSDLKKLETNGDLSLRLLTSNNYYPFGMLQPGRTYNTDGYRYGFNGKEMDNDWKGTGNVYDYGFRIYDPRIAKFLSVDPLTKEYPWYTPYQFAGNNPIKFIDLDGKEPVPAPLPNGEMVTVVVHEGKSVENFINVSHEMLMSVGVNERYGNLSFDNTDGIMDFVDQANAFAQKYYDAVTMKKQNGVKTPVERKEDPPMSIGEKIIKNIATESELKQYTADAVAYKFDAITPDAIGISINGNLIVGGGFGGELSLGMFKNGDIAAYATGKGGSGYDISFGISLWAVYSNRPDFGPSSLKGPSIYQDAGAAFANAGTFQSVSREGIGRDYSGGSIGITIGSKSVVGGSAGGSLTGGGKVGNMTYPSQKEIENATKED